MIHYQTYHFDCAWTSRAFMPSYWGSALRGGMGKWLKKATCALRHNQCSGCAIRNTCAYGYIFETESTTPAKKQSVNARPHPIVLQLPYPSNFSTKEGDHFLFSIVLIDKAQTFLPHIIYSITKLGKEDGIGAKTNHGYGRFEICSISTDKHILYKKEDGELTLAGQPKALELTNGSHKPVTKMVIEFRTPFRVKYKGKFSYRIPFHLLVRTALRRVSTLETFYGPGEPDLDYLGLINAAHDVLTTKEDLKWHEVPRFSSRQKQKMMIGGVVGQAAYEGENLAPFAPLLQYCETVHLGKQTFFGLGRIRIAGK